MVEDQKQHFEKIREALDLLNYFNDAGNLTDDEEQTLVRAHHALKKLGNSVPCGDVGCMAADCADCNPVTREVYLSKYVTREEFDAMTKRAYERITNLSQATDRRFKTVEQIVKSQSKASPIDKVEKL